MKKNANFQLIKTTVLMDYFKHLMGRYIKKKNTNFIQDEIY